MNRVSIGLEKAYRGWDVPAYRYDRAGRNVASVPEDAQGISAEMVDVLRRKYEENGCPSWVFSEQLIYMVFGCNEDLIILGPVFLYGVSEGKAEEKLVCLFPEKAAACLSTVYYLITGEYVSEESLLQRKEKQTPLWEEGAVNKFLHFAEEDGERYGYDMEQEWMGLISRGELEQQQVDMKRTYKELYRVGILTERGEKKQAEYMMVSAITLASRAAIQGGIDSHRAYELSDLCLQKLSAAKNVQEMIIVGMESVSMFNALVREHLVHAGGNVYCEQTKNYIGRHIREKIRISDIADYVGLNSSYLTHLFSQEVGMSVKSYIMQERLKLAANLLKNTDESIGMISDYLHFNSQSYFTSCFRKQYDMMPTEYRQKFKNFL